MIIQNLFTFPGVVVRVALQEPPAVRHAYQIPHTRTKYRVPDTAVRTASLSQ